LQLQPRFNPQTGLPIPSTRTPLPTDQQPTEEPIDIETLFTDQDILDYLQGVVESPTGNFPAVIDVVPGTTQTTRNVRTVAPTRTVGGGDVSAFGRKEPIFGGDPNQQQDVWNIRSLRLKKYLGL
jgi:hypothetical protein